MVKITFIDKMNFIESAGFNFGSYQIKEDGIYCESSRISSIAIIPESILYNIDDDTEKVELSMYKYHRWITIVVNRSAIASKNQLVKLSDKGLETCESNATALMKYFSWFIQNNFDKLKHSDCKSSLGWIGDGFAPYSGDVVFDGDSSQGSLFDSVKSKGDMLEWISFVEKLRAYRIEMRLVMAASFAAPLIERIGENPFCLHLWGGTGAGKTVALMVAMSIWGNPEIGKLVRTMNMTTNSMLSMASVLRNLPFAGDELQTIRSNNTTYDKLIMQVTEGIDRARMTSDGRINPTKTWKCSFIFSGEEPCVKPESGGGAKNRVIEIECNDKLVENGNASANFVRRNYGLAGEPYIKAILSRKDLNKEYSDIFDLIMKTTDTTAKQAGAMAIMLLADRIASETFWPGEDALTVDIVEDYLSSENDVDMTERAYSYLVDIIGENASNFSEYARQRWGIFEEHSSEVWFNRTVMNRVMSEAGFDVAACVSKWRVRGKIRTFKRKDGGFATTKVKYIKCDNISSRVRCYCVVLPDVDGADQIIADSEAEQLPV